MKRSGVKITNFFTKKSGVVSENINVLREMHIPMRMQEMFLTASRSNTDAHIETCGLLCGRMTIDRLTVTHLLIPRQTGMPESCMMHDEDEVSQYCLQHDIATLGWIHTHPTQASFLSSVDLHTQCTYQSMLHESIAVVCSLMHDAPIIGFFSLTDEGMDLIKSCKGSGFHPHESKPGQTLYRNATHIKVDPLLPCMLADLRIDKPTNESPAAQSDNLDYQLVSDSDNSSEEQTVKDEISDVTVEVSESSVQTCACCTCDEPNQPLNYNYEATRKNYGKQTRKFDPRWFKKWSWLHFCEKRNLVLCSCCSWMERGKRWTNANRIREGAFSVNGFSGWHIATQRYEIHEQSDAHKGACIAWERRRCSSAVTLLSTQHASDQKNRFSNLCTQIGSLRFLARQGLAIRGHTEKEGNLVQLMLLGSQDCAILQSWLTKGDYMSHEIVNEQLSIMSLELLRNLLADVRKSHCFSVIADETRDLSGTEQLSISIRWVDAVDNEVREECIGLVALEKTDGAYLESVITDTLLRCDLDMNRLVGQGYDGGSNMAGHINGVAARIQQKFKAALFVHCNNHCLQLCLQDAATESNCMRDALNLCTQLYSLIKLSPKRLAIFDKLQTLKTKPDTSHTSIKPLCPTRWTVRSAAISSVLDNYEVIQDTLDVIITEGKRDEVAQKAAGIMSQMEKFTILFGLYMSEVIFSASDQAATTLQGKDVTAANASEIIKSLQTYLVNLRDSFEAMWSDVSKLANDKQIVITMPRQRKAAYKLDDTRSQHLFETEEYYQQQFNAVIDVISGELTSGFNQPTMSRLIDVETLLVDAANDRFQPVPTHLEVILKCRHISVLCDIVYLYSRKPYK